MTLIDCRDTQAQSVVRFLYPTLGAFDVFMTISTREGPNEPKVGDLSTCEPYRPHNGGSLACEVLKETPVRVFPSEAFSTFYYAG